MKKNNNTLRTLITASALTFPLIGRANAAITVINGGFEDTTGMTTSGSFYQGVIPGWTYPPGVTSEIATTSSPGAPAGVSGNNFLEITETVSGTGTLSQTVSGMTVNLDYVLTFDWGNRQDSAGDDYEFQVSIAGQNFIKFGSGPVNMTAASILFTANNPSETISITFYPTSSASLTDGAFDNFAIRQVPEPSSTVLIGIGGLCLILRRKRA